MWNPQVRLQMLAVTSVQLQRRELTPLTSTLSPGRVVLSDYQHPMGCPLWWPNEQCICCMRLPSGPDVLYISLLHRLQHESSSSCARSWSKW
jgi:hypothetical protein